MNNKFERFDFDFDIVTKLHDNIEPGKFRFASNPEKIEMFMEWLREEQKRFILTHGFFGVQTTTRPGLGKFEVSPKPWTNMYIQSAYQQGIARARSELRKKGYDVPTAAGAFSTTKTKAISAAFNQPIHADRVGIIYTRAFNELKGITEAMDQQISRVLAEGLVEGRGANYIASEIFNRVDSIGMVRARALARTEVVSAHHQATINEYEIWGVQGVTVQAEWITAGFGVCPVCQELSHGGDIAPGFYSLSKIRWMIPVHPNCRCCAIPATNKMVAEKLKDVAKAAGIAATILPSTLNMIMDKKDYSDSIMIGRKQITEKELERVYTTYPGVRTVLDETKLDIELKRANLLPGDCSGYYHPPSKTITLATMRPEKSDYVLGGLSVFNTDVSYTGSLRHELGHHIDFTSKQLAAVQGKDAFYYKEKIHKLFNEGVGMQICKYAIGSPEEMFACGTSVFLHPDYRGDLPIGLHNLLKEMLE